jgi:hypothetical protein
MWWWTMTTAPTTPHSGQKKQAKQPLFYGRPVAISPEAFRGKSLAMSANRAFARKTNLVPLNAGEFALAQRHYPIVFAVEPPHFAMAIVGVRNDENLFVGADGHWEADAYVPAYIRRYPFILMGKPGDKEFLLCADVDSAYVVDGNDNPFFKDGNPSEAVKKAVAFCRTFQGDAEKTQAFCAALAEQELLQARAAELALPGGRKVRLGPFRMVDEKKLAELPAKVVTEWHARGWLRLVHAHLFSLANWTNLATHFSVH